MAVIQRSAGRRCRYCGELLTGSGARLKQLCAGWKCRTAYFREQQALRRRGDGQRREEYERRVAGATAARDAAAPRSGIATPALHRVVVTPANERPVVPLKRKRRYRFVNRLIRLIEATLQDRPAGVEARGEDEASELPIVEAACANCRGSCCLRGGTRAYLNAGVIGRLIDARREATVRELVEGYARLLPRETYRDSCVFHSPSGCTLPRPLRANTCENFVCEGVIALRERMCAGGASGFFLAAVNGARVLRGRFETVGQEGE